MAEKKTDTRTAKVAICPFDKKTCAHECLAFDDRDGCMFVRAACFVFNAGKTVMKDYMNSKQRADTSVGADTSSKKDTSVVNMWQDGKLVNSVEAITNLDEDAMKRNKEILQSWDKNVEQKVKSGHIGSVSDLSSLMRKGKNGMDLYCKTCNVQYVFESGCAHCPTCGASKCD